MTSQKTKNELFVRIILVFISAAVLILPIIIQLITIGQNFRGVPTDYIVDSLYYFARIHDVVRGHPLIGNPYLWEHRQSWPVAFFAVDWLATLPAFVLPLWQTVIVNTVFWGLAFVLLIYQLLRRLEVSSGWSAAGAFFSLLIAYLLVIRPVSMQQVFPFFLLFLILAWQWWQRPSGKKSFFLALFYASSYMIYTYLFQFTAIMLVLLIVVKKSGKLLAWFLFFSLPAFLMVYFQTHQPFYWETLSRIGLVHTHLPNVQAFVNGGLAFLAFLLLLAIFPSKRRSAGFLLLVGVSLLLVNFSNVILGVELETANYIGRMLDLWRVFCIVLALFVAFPKKKLILALVVINLMTFLPAVADAGRLIFPQPQNDWTKVQSLATPIGFLDSRDRTPQVVWANQTVSRYIPILSKNYILFVWEAHLQLAPSAELADRFLVDHYFDNLSLQDIKNNLRVYAGVGPAVHQPAIINYASKICPFCIRPTTAEKLLGENYFPNLWKNYQAINNQNLTTYLAKYHVKYLLVDKNHDTWKIDFAWPKIYEDKDFLIYQIPVPASQDALPM